MSSPGHRRSDLDRSIGWRVHRAFTVKWTRCRCVDPDNQDRAGAVRVRNDAALDPERLPSYRVLAEKLRESDFLARLFTRSLETRAPVRSFGAPRHPVKSASVPRELDSPSTRAFRRRATHEPKMRPADVCNLRFQRREPVISCGARIRVDVNRPHRRTVPLAATARFGHRIAAPARVLFPLALATTRRPLMFPSLFGLRRARCQLRPHSQDRLCHHQRRW